MTQNTHGALAAHSTTGQPRAVARQDVGPRPFTRFFPATETMVAHTPSQLPLSFETPTSHIGGCGKGRLPLTGLHSGSDQGILGAGELDCVRPGATHHPRPHTPQDLVQTIAD